jgi:histidyl-tRNA synthetase
VSYQSLKGFNDILPGDSELWLWLENEIRAVMRLYGFGEARLPIVESTELFKRGIGEGTDVVGKEMYSFLDKGDPPESITLRPELTASAARAFVEHGIGQNNAITRWYYIGPAFRYEQPQAGRYRQFYTFGVELIGSPHPEADAETILIAADLLKRIGLDRYRLRLNSIGTADERVEYRRALLEYLETRRDQLSEESVRRMSANPLRVLDSKKREDIAATAEAPSIIDHLGDESREHFDTVRALLEANGIEYIIDNRLVRGLDYYTRTAFEFQGLDLGAQDALLGGGRYDGLIEQVGGKPTPAIGFGLGIERIILALKNAGRLPNIPADTDVYVIGLDDASRRWASAFVHDVRSAGLAAEYDLLRRSMKAQMRDANRRGARFVVIVGENEIAAREAQVKDMRGGTQRAVPFDALLGELLAGAGEPPVATEEVGPISES